MKEYIKKQIGNIKKFSFAEMTSNSSGKTSGSGTAGLYIVFIGGLTFLIGCVDKMFLNNDIDVITQSVVLVGIGASLLGYRKSKDNSEEPNKGCLISLFSCFNISFNFCNSFKLGVSLDVVSLDLHIFSCLFKLL